MRKTYTHLLLALSLLLVPGLTFATLSGNYTINASAAASATNYQSFAAAVGDLNSGTRTDGGPVQGPGVSGPVTITVAAGTYTESVILNQIAGASATNTITFDGVNPATRKLTWAGTGTTTAYTFQMNGSDYVRVHNLHIENTGATYAYPMQLINQCNFSEVKGCSLTVSTTATGTRVIPFITGSTYTNYSNHANYCNIEDNDMVGGRYGLVLLGGSSGYGQGNSVIGNRVTDTYYMGMNIYYQNLPTVEDNEVTMRNGSLSSAYGMRFYYCTDFDISYNIIKNSGTYGLYMYYGNQQLSTQKGRIYGNMIGGGFQTTGSCYGLYLSSVRNARVLHNSTHADIGTSSRGFYLVGSCSGNDVRNNSFAYSGGSSGYAFYCSSLNYVASMDYNNYYTNGSNLAYFQGVHATLTSLQASNANYHQNCQDVWPNYVSATDLHTFGAALANWADTSTVVVDVDGDTRPLPPDLIKDVGADEYVLAAFDLDLIAITSPTVLVTGNNTVTVDLLNNGNNSINGQNITLQYSTNGGTTWSVTETWSATGLGATGDIASYSFTAPWNVAAAGTYNLCVRINPTISGDPDATDMLCVNVCTGMSGAYTINPAVATGGFNFQTFTDAAAALSSCGISGPVTITASPGTYTESFVIGSIPGASAANTVVIDGVHMDSVSVEYSYASTGSQYHIVHLAGADYLTIKNLTIKATGNYGYCLQISNQSNYIEVSDCRIQASQAVTSLYNIAVLVGGPTYSTAGDHANNFYFHDNILTGGYYGMRMNGTSSSVYADSNRIINNSITEYYYYGLYTTYQGNLEVNENTFVLSPSGGTGGYGMYLYYANGNFKVKSNTVHSVGSRALYVYYGNQNGTGRSEITNNMFGANWATTGTAYPMYLYNVRNTDIYHNTINSGFTTGYATYITGSLTSGLDIRNNIFAADAGSATALYLTSTAAVTTLDYNAYYSNNTLSLIRVGSTNYGTLQAFKNANPARETNGISVFPAFAGNTDLHLFCTPALDSSGTPISSITDDVDGQSRDASFPDIGADEFNSITVAVSLGPDTSVCGVAPLIADTLQWSVFKWKGNSSNYFYNADTSGTYWLTVRDSNNCEASDSINVVIFVQPDEPFNQDSVVICPSTALDAQNPGSTYLWNTTDTSQIIGPQTGGFYNVEITSADGCVERDTIFVDFFNAIGTNLGPDQTFCLGNSATLDAGQSHPLQTYSWNTGAFSQVVVASAPGYYWVTVTSPDGCVASDSVYLNAQLPPVVNLGPDRTECGPFTLDAGNGGSTYSWQNSSSNQTLSASTSGNYYVTVTNSAGCSTTDSVSINVATPPSVNLGQDRVLCNNQAETLDAGNPGATYLWSTGQTSQTVSVTNPGVYIVQVTNAAGCTGYDTVSVTTSGLTVNLGGSQILCPGEQLVLDAGNPGSTYSWSDGSTNQTLLISSPGTYSVTVLDGLGCSATSTSNVTSGPGITANFSAPGSTPLFQPVQFSDQTSGAVSWFWDFGDGNTSTQQNPSHIYLAMGTFNVCLTVSNGSCENTFCDDVLIAAPVGIEDEEFAGGISIYPNPSNGIFNLGFGFNETHDLNVSIVNLMGQEIFNTKLTSVMNRTEAVDISDRSAGIYLLRVSDPDGREEVRKLIIE